MRIVHKALARYPSQRFATAEAFANALRAYLYSKDPAFTAARLGEVMSRVFPEEKEAMENLELYEEEDLDDAPRELTFGGLNKPGPGQAVTAVARTRQVSPDAALRALLSPPSTDSLDSVEPTMPSGDDVLASPHDATATGWAQGAAAHPSTALAPDDSGRDAALSSLAEEPTRDMAQPGLSTSGTGLTGDAEVELPRGELTEDAYQQAFGGPRWGRVILRGVVLGVVLATLGVAGVEWRALQTKPSTTTGATSTQSPAGKVPVLVDAEPHPATLMVGGEGTARALPSIVMSSPGATLELTFSAPGYRERTTTYMVPKSGGDARTSVQLEPLDVPLTLRVTPDDATVTVNGAPYVVGQTVAPFTDVKIHAEKEGYDTVEVTRQAQPGNPLDIEVVLEKDAGEPSKQADKRPRGSGFLVITSQPYWGRVTIDGKTLDEVTPVKTKVRAGRHRVRVTHPPKGLSREFTVKVRAGKTTTKRVTF